MNPTLDELLRRFILTHAPVEGFSTVEGRDLVRTLWAGYEHRIAFRRADREDWLVYAWGYDMSGALVGLQERPELSHGGLMDDEDEGELALWLMMVLA